MLITGDPEVARYAVDCGVGRIFVDMEQLGKAERQPGDTVKNSCTLADVDRVRKAVPDAQVLTRLDPWGDHSPGQIQGAIDAGTDLIMLPMFRTLAEIQSCANAIGGQARFMPLAEVPEALGIASEVALERGVDEVYLGLNDLRIARGGAFLFEPLADGEVDAFAAQVRQKPFGFGGIAQVGGGLVDGARIVREHVRLGSSVVILSRDFHNRSATLEDFRTKVDLPTEIQRIREAEAEAMSWSAERLALAHEETSELIRDVARRIREKAV